MRSDERHHRGPARTRTRARGSPAAPPAARPGRRDSIPIEYYGLRRGTVTAVTTLCVLFALFTLIPIAWLVINSTKTQANIFESFGFWFASPFVFGKNFALLFQNVDGYGIYFRWFGNTVLYAVVGGGGATALAALAGVRVRPVPLPRLTGRCSTWSSRRCWCRSRRSPCRCT